MSKRTPIQSKKIYISSGSGNNVKVARWIRRGWESTKTTVVKNIPSTSIMNATTIIFTTIMPMSILPPMYFHLTDQYPTDKVCPSETVTTMTMMESITNR
ncbi:3696_t:CDS:2 [Acaulospora morrowiae]|uniref:3696_t:CDS:1 n=1 Tax=Acaulospora morrowiae TaxID=94023 RepID=A0A9N9FSA9_9GLOM|nr:3696_t:CDS:2 [Acaulospora morrowiae]